MLALAALGVTVSTFHISGLVKQLMKSRPDCIVQYHIYMLLTDRQLIK